MCESQTLFLRIQFVFGLNRSHYLNQQEPFLELHANCVKLKFIINLRPMVTVFMFTLIWRMFIHMCMPLRTRDHDIHLNSAASGIFADFLQSEIFCCSVKQYALLKAIIAIIRPQHATYKSKSSKSARKPTVIAKTEVMLCHSSFQLLSL